MPRLRFVVWAFLALHAALLAQGNPVPASRKAAMAKDFPAAEKLLADYRAQNPGLTPQWLEAVSWAARGASFVKEWDKAEAYALETFKGCQALLKDRALDADRNLPIALGAAIEVLGAVTDASDDRGGAVQFLRKMHAHYKETSIATRIQKNILLLTLEGKPAPPVAVPQWLGAKGKTLPELKGQVVLLFFWAHWCGDCKAQKPILDRLAADYGARGLTIVGPTQFYGYIARGESATPEQELHYLQTDYQQAHPIPSWMSVPISSENFHNFGVSTTPTLMLVDRKGIVRLYNPGHLSYEALTAKIEPLLAPRT
jgi:thiol-disulfide isomerase/thioredoxin